MRIYVAGPMRGIPFWNRDAFAEVTGILREQGHEVISPHEEDCKLGYVAPEDGAGGHLSDYPIGQDLMIVANSDAVCVLPGWRKSQGARLEATVALVLGVPVMAHTKRGLVRVPESRVRSAAHDLIDG